MKTILFALLSSALIAIQVPAMAHDGKHDKAAPAHIHKTGWVQGEVVKIDKPRKHITLKHEEIVSSGMEAMTMPFQVNSVALLDKVKLGDRVRFELEAKNDELSLIRLERIK